MSKKYGYNKSKNEFTKEMINDTLKYQKRYGFELGKNNSAHNNEADAFRHAYMQSLLNKNYGSIKTKLGSAAHEWRGNLMGQDPRESNMDMWNNQQGQQIYNEIKKEYPNFNRLSESQQKDIVAQKVIQRMKDGKLITSLDDNRKFQEPKPDFIPTRGIGGVQNDGIPSGFATPIQQSGLFDYTNPLTGDNRIFTREEISEMSPEEFAKHEKEIDAQTKYFNGTMPTNSDLKSTDGVIYVNSYTRSDGTQVKGYYRSKCN